MLSELDRRRKNLMIFGVGLKLLNTLNTSISSSDKPLALTYFQYFGDNLLIPFTLMTALRYVGLGYKSSIFVSVALPVVLEVLQKYDLYPGTYHPLDFLFTVAGVGVATAVDYYLTRKRFLKDKP